ncbi:roadblock/LC7 domain-containing protein [Methanobacterium sp.]|jgi:predicted regulator of Ras-like GTPase activity (Roadblock/LC7/MglB family)|uniref:roadblock/LC7 domain-containing protein n=1 Tax=Methanobacterium sp. TaxID=2164 RepID=UPI0031596D8F
MEPISKQIKNVLDEMHSKARIMESYVIRKDGLIICSYIPGSNSQRISAMSAALMELGKRTLKNIGNDDMKLIMVSGNKMNIVISGSNSIALVCAVGSEVNIGMIFLLIKKAVPKIQSILEESYENVSVVWTQ